MEIDKEEIRRLAGKLLADTRRKRVNHKRYDWTVVREWALAWLAANPSADAATSPAAPSQSTDGDAVLDQLRADEAAAGVLIQLHAGTLDRDDVSEDVLSWLESRGLIGSDHAVTSLGAWAAGKLGKPEDSADLSEEAAELADHISAAQAECLRTVFNDGNVGEAGKATVGALVNKGLIVVAEDPEDGVDITPLGTAVAAMLATK